MTPTLAAFATLQVLDVLTTWLGLRAGAVEANPYPRALLEAGGIAELAAVKALAAFLVVWLVLALPSRSRPYSRFALQFVNVVLAFAVLSNTGLGMHWSD